MEKERIQEAYERTILNENFARGKDIKWIAGYLDGMANAWLKKLKTAKSSGQYGTYVNNIVDDGLDDLKKIQQQLDKMGTTGKL